MSPIGSDDRDALRIAALRRSGLLQDETFAQRVVRDGLIPAPVSASVAAQFIADKASVQGNESIEIAPKFNRAIKHPPPAISELIR